MAKGRTAFTQHPLMNMN